MVAFTKILKKFDKVSNQQASASYLKAVKISRFISSDKRQETGHDPDSITMFKLTHTRGKDEVPIDAES